MLNTPGVVTTSIKAINTSMPFDIASRSRPHRPCRTRCDLERFFTIDVSYEGYHEGTSTYRYL